MKTTRLLILTSTLALLAACGGSSDDSEDVFPLSSLQFFNASSNSASTRLLVDEASIGSSVFGDATTLVSLEEDTYDLALVK